MFLLDNFMNFNDGLRRKARYLLLHCKQSCKAKFRNDKDLD